MGLFSFFKKLPKIDDEFFGTLTFTEINDDPGNSYFEGRGKFNPTGDDIEYFIDADISGPTQQQREFYIQLQNIYSELIVKIKPVIEDEFQNVKRDFVIVDFRKEFKLVALSIPRLDHNPFTWDLSFDTVHYQDSQVTVEFRNFEPKGVTING